MVFEYIQDEQTTDVPVKIKIIGVGGGGGNAINNMIKTGVNYVEFIAANTDAQALEKSLAHKVIQLGSQGLGAGAKPEQGRLAAESSIDAIREALQGADMVFVTAGMGGGTGTGAAPVIAQAASDMGILTVGVVTKPFSFERRDKSARNGIDELQQHVDSLITIPNDGLREVFGGNFSLTQAFACVDQVLKDAVDGIVDLIMRPGIINVDFQDLKTVMSERGKAIMGIGSATGEGRALAAVEQAIQNPLLKDVDINNVRGILVNVCGSDVNLEEFDEIGHYVNGLAAQDAQVIVGMSLDDALGDTMRVTVVATGLNSIDAVMPQTTPHFAPQPVNGGQRQAPAQGFGGFSQHQPRAAEKPVDGIMSGFGGQSVLAGQLNREIHMPAQPAQATGTEHFSAPRQLGGQGAALDISRFLGDGNYDLPPVLRNQLD
jgi:cell division protein FtsZ